MSFIEAVWHYNDQIFFALHNLSYGHPILDWGIAFFGEHIDIWILAGLTVFLMLRALRNYIPRNPLVDWFLNTQFFRIIISGLLAWLVSYILKITIAAPRPYIVFSEITPLFGTSTPLQSFPSGHTTLFFALATAVYIRHRGWGIVALILAFLIAISRIIAGVHFPIDILGGIIFGVLIAIFVFKGLKKWVY